MLIISIALFFYVYPMRQLKINKSITSRDDASLDKYLHEIAKEKMISIEEEIDLAKRIKLGDQAALEKLTKANLRFVVTVAKQYQNQWLSLNDLINEGNLGLIKAAQRYDETRGFKFISYAVWWIRQSIIAAISEQSRIVRLPQNKIIKMGVIQKTTLRLEQELQRSPSEQEVAEYLDMDEEKVLEYSVYAQKDGHLDNPVWWDSEQWPVIDTIESTLSAPDHGLNDEWLANELKRLLTTITPKERQAIILFFWLNGKREHTADELSKLLKFSSAWSVRVAIDRAIKKLKSWKKIEHLKSYL